MSNVNLNEIYKLIGNVELPNPLVLDHAEQFRDAARSLRGAPQFCRLAAPLDVLCGFAIELYLKSLNSIYFRKPADLVGLSIEMAFPLEKGHNLVRLYETLDPVVRSHLDADFKVSALVQRYETIVEGLSKFQNLFVESRYSFEASGRHGDGSLEELLDLLEYFSEYSLRAREWFRNVGYFSEPSGARVTHVTVRLELPEDLARLQLPSGVSVRLRSLLDRQSQGMPLTSAEQAEVEGLVELDNFLSILRPRAERYRG